MPIIGEQTKIPQDEILKIGTYPVVTQEAENEIAGYTDVETPITDLPLVVFGDHSCTFKYIDYEFVRGADGTQLMKFNSDVVIPKYMYFLLQHTEIPNAGRYERHYKYLKELTVYVPALTDQQRIVAQVEQYEAEIRKAQAVMDGCAARKKVIIEKYLNN